MFDKIDGGYPNPEYHFLQSGMTKKRNEERKKEKKIKDENQLTTSKGRAVKQASE